MKNKKIVKKWDDAIDKGDVIVCEQDSDFLLRLWATEYYKAAKVLQENGITNGPYNILLSLSTECYLKSINTKAYWRNRRGVGVLHEQGHDQSALFEAIVNNSPEQAEYLSRRYLKDFGRDLATDISRNANVFTSRRYPYKYDFSIPQQDNSYLWDTSYSRQTWEQGKLDNHLTIDLTAFENVAQFFHNVLSVRV